MVFVARMALTVVQGAHRDVPGAFAVRFIVAGEPLTTDKPRFCNQVTPTVEYRSGRAERKIDI